MCHFTVSASKNDDDLATQTTSDSTSQQDTASSNSTGISSISITDGQNIAENPSFNDDTRHLVD